MKVKRLSRIICAALLAGTALTVPFAMTGCGAVDHPEVQITVKYEEKEYVLEYTLYRNMYPQTVTHFIELAENGFYNNTYVHDANSSDSAWYCGGYSFINGNESFDEAYSKYTAAYKNTDDMRDYIEDTSKEEAYYLLADPDKGLITPSVYLNYLNGTYSEPLSTLIGEFKNNNHKIDKGALNRSFGCLTMYYSAKDTTKVADVLGYDSVWLKKQGSNSGVQGTYDKNSATSIFGIYNGTSTAPWDKYCIFGKLNNEDVLTTLKKEIGSTKQITEVGINKYDEVLRSSNPVTYRLCQYPIVIESVKVTKK